MRLHGTALVPSAPDVGVCRPVAGGPMARSRGRVVCRWFLLPVVAILTSACDPQALADSALRRAAGSVVMAVVQNEMPSPAAARATECILQNARPDEIEALARDVGVVAGTLTKANIRTIALRPAAQACFAANDVPPVIA